MEIYAIIRDKIHSRGYGPTVREIGHAFKIRSPNGVVCHLKALERKGLITRGKNMSRAIELVNEPAHLRGLPMAGWVAAGTLRPTDRRDRGRVWPSLWRHPQRLTASAWWRPTEVDVELGEGDLDPGLPKPFMDRGMNVVDHVEPAVERIEIESQRDREG